MRSRVGAFIPRLSRASNTMDEYLGRKRTKKHARTESTRQAYEALCLAFPGVKIPFENTKAEDPLLLTWLQSEMHKHGEDGAVRWNAVPVPSYWKFKAPRNFHNVKHCIPHFIRESGLVDMRRELYSSVACRKGPQKTVRPRLGRMGLNLQRLYDRCMAYPFHPVLDAAYDGTDSFFLLSCRKGTITDELHEALGDLPAPLQDGGEEAGGVRRLSQPATPSMEHLEENERNTDGKAPQQVYCGPPGHPRKPGKEDGCQDDSGRPVPSNFQDKDAALQKRSAAEEKEGKTHAKIKRFRF